MNHHGFDAANHPFETEEPDATIQKKRKRKDFPRDIIEETRMQKMIRTIIVLTKGKIFKSLPTRKDSGLVTMIMRL